MATACLQPARYPALRRPQPQRSRRLVLQAATHPAAGGEAASGDSGASGRGLCRERVELVVPGKGATPFVHVTQRALNNILTVTGALGFEDANGEVSQELEDLPDDRPVKLVLPTDPPLGTQVRNLQQATDNVTRGKEQRLAAYLIRFARAEAPGAPLVTLQSKPFAVADGQDFVQLDAAVVVGPMLVLGEHKNVLGEWSVIDVLKKLKKIRAACTSGASPDLAAALQGVSHVKVFLAGEVVREGLTVQNFVEAAAAADMSVVLPSAQGLEVVGNAPAVQL